MTTPAAAKPGQLIVAVGLVDEFVDERDCTRAAAEALRGAGIDESSLRAATVPTVGSNRKAVVLTAYKR